MSTSAAEIPVAVALQELFKATENLTAETALRLGRFFGTSAPNFG